VVLTFIVLLITLVLYDLLTVFHLNTFIKLNKTENTSYQYQKELNNLNNYLAVIGVAENGFFTKYNQKYIANFPLYKDSCLNSIAKLKAIKGLSKDIITQLNVLQQLTINRISITEKIYNLILANKIAEAKKIQQSGTGGEWRMKTKDMIIDLENKLYTSQEKINELEDENNASIKQNLLVLGLLALITISLLLFRLYKRINKSQQLNNSLEQLVNERTQTLIEQNTKLNIIYGASPIYLLELNKEGHIISANKPLAQQSKNELIGKKITELIHLKTTIDFDDILIDVFENKYHREATFTIQNNNKIFTYLGYYAPITINHQVKSVLLTVLDITELKEKQIKSNELSAIIENSSFCVGMAAITNRKTLYLNKAFRKLLGVSDKDDLSSFYAFNFYSEKGLGIIKDAFIKVAKYGYWFGENEMQDLSGKKIPVYQSLLLHTNENNVPTHTSTTVVDLTELKEKEYELIKMNSELIDIYNKLQNIREEERSEIARELHDDLGQFLTILKFDTTWLKDHLTINNETIKAKLENIIENTQNTINTSRRLMNTLNPNMLDDMGLLATVKWHVHTYEKSTGLAINLNCFPEKMEFAKKVNRCIYRIIQEGLTNIIRYAKATKVEITIEYENKEVAIEIKDDGIGFDTSKIDGHKSHGISGMKDRVMALEGSFTINSAINKGTTIKVLLQNAPLKEN
jgi:signal transduction histidine kinase